MLRKYEIAGFHIKLFRISPPMIISSGFPSPLWKVLTGENM